MADPDSRSGTRYGDPAILDYVDGVHHVHDAGLEQAYTAPDRVEAMPAIQLGRGEGKLLEFLIRLGQVRRAVEVGTLAGYSAIRIARALPWDGKLITLELEPAFAEVARANLATAGLSNRVEVRVGSALDALEDLASDGPFDAVFLDADKESYEKYARWAHANLRAGGLLIADNAYLFGNLMAQTERARGMRAFHEFVAESFDSLCVPTPDGMVVGIKS